MPYFKGTMEVLELDSAAYVKALKKHLEVHMRNAARRFVRAALPHIPIRTGFLRGAWDPIEEALNDHTDSATAEVRRWARKLEKIVKSRKVPVEVIGGLHERLKKNPNAKLTEEEKKFPDIHETKAIIKKLHEARDELNRQKKLEKAAPAFERLFKIGRERGIHLNKNLRGGKPEYYYPGDGSKILKTRFNGRDFSIPPDKMFVTKGNNLEFHFWIDIIYFRINDFYGGHSPTAPWRSMELGREAFVTYMQEKALPKLPRISEFFTRTVVGFDKTGVSTKERLNIVRRKKTPLPPEN